MMELESTRLDSTHITLRRSLMTLILVLAFAAGFTPILAATPTLTADPTPTPIPESGLVTLALLGDINLGRGVYPNTDTFAYLMPVLESADLAMANLESPSDDQNRYDKIALCPLHRSGES